MKHMTKGAPQSLKTTITLILGAVVFGLVVIALMNEAPPKRDWRDGPATVSKANKPQLKKQPAIGPARKAAP